jgi:nucleotide-binding universal stress UspA family protein
MGCLKMIEKRWLMMAEKNNGHFKILLGDDHSEHALAAVALLEDLPFPAGTDITIFRAFAPTQSTDVILMEEALNQTCNRLRKKGMHAKPELLLGFPTEKFIRYAEEQMPDLIIIGAKGLRTTAGILMGGVAQQVVEYAPCPVLVVRAPYNGLREVMLVTDGSASSKQAVHFLGRLPLPVGARLWVMHVLPPSPIPMMILETPMGNVPIAFKDSGEAAVLKAQEEKDGQALVGSTLEALQAMGKPAEGILKRGDAATEIMAVVKEQNIDLLITGSRGLTPIRSWMMGSVSRKLVHYSGCSVLVVRNLPLG